HPRPRDDDQVGGHRARGAAAARFGDRRAGRRPPRAEDETRAAAHDPRHRHPRCRLPARAPARLAAGGDLYGAAAVRGRLHALLLALAAPLLLGAAQPRLVPDVSNRNVEIRYSFAGEQLLLFGAIIYPDGRPPEGATDIAVVLKGPVEPIVVREKRKVAGIWMNVGRVRFRSAPAFYAVASSRPLDRLVDDRMAAIYELGLDNLQLSPSGGVDVRTMRRFAQGLIDLRRRNQLYAEYPHGVEISEGV